MRIEFWATSHVTHRLPASVTHEKKERDCYDTEYENVSFSMAGEQRNQYMALTWAVVSNGVLPVCVREQQSEL